MLRSICAATVTLILALGCLLSPGIMAGAAPAPVVSTTPAEPAAIQEALALERPSPPDIYDPAYWTAPADPLDLTVTLDVAHAASAKIGSGGGSLTATSSDGTVFTLTIPKRSLLRTTTITMTPISRIEARGKAAEGSQVAAVQIEPSGTLLFLPAKLEIVPGTADAGAVGVPFAFDRSGDDASLVTPDLREEGTVLLLDHFSGYGSINWGFRAGLSSEYDLANELMDHIGIAIAEKRLSSIVSAELARERQRELMGTADGSFSLEDLFNRAVEPWREHLFKPALELAANPGATCADSGRAIALWFAFERQRQLLGLPDQAPDDGVKAVAAAVKGCRADALAQCLATGDYQVLLLSLLGEEHIYQLGGVADDTAGARLAYADMMKQCAVYDLKYTMTLAEVSSLSVSSVLDGHVMLKAIVDAAFPFGMRIEGTGEGEQNPFLTSIQCSVADPEIPEKEFTCGPGLTIRAQAEAKIVSMSMRTPTESEGANDALASLGEDALVLRFDPPAAVVDNLRTYADGAKQESLWTLQGPYDWVAEINETRGEVYLVPDWKRQGLYPTLFQTTFAGNGQTGSTTWSSSTTFELIHKPQPGPDLTQLPPSPPRRPLVPRVAPLSPTPPPG